MNAIVKCTRDAWRCHRYSFTHGQISTLVSVSLECLELTTPFPHLSDCISDMAHVVVHTYTLNY